MKLTMKVLALFFGLLMLANIANADPPREQLKQMVEQLQANPSDDALREKIIKLAQTIKPVPTVPEEAIRYEGRAQAAFNAAKSQFDYLAAADEYEKAVTVAPWVLGYYSDLCTIYEKAGVYVEAKKNCERSLIGEERKAEATAIKRRIAGLDYLAGKYSSSLLATNFSEPFDETLSDFPIGTKYFCWAKYDEYAGPFYYFKLEDTRSRFEQWIVISGDIATEVDVGYLDSLAFAEVVRNGRQRHDAKVIESIKLKNPLIKTGTVVPKDKSQRNTFSRWSEYGKKELMDRITMSDDGSKVTFWRSALFGPLQNECTRK